MGPSSVSTRPIASSAAAVEKYWQGGRHLTVVKKGTPHGEWRSWLKSVGISKSKAHRLIQLSQYELSQLGTFDSVDAALQALLPARQKMPTAASETPEEAVPEVEVPEPADDEVEEAEVEEAEVDEAEDDEYEPRKILPSMVTPGLEGNRTNRIKEGQRATVLQSCEDRTTLRLAVPLPPWRGNTWQKWQPVGLIEFKTKAQLTHTNGKMVHLQISERRFYGSSLIELFTASLDVEVLWKDKVVDDILAIREKKARPEAEEENH